MLYYAMMTRFEPHYGLPLFLEIFSYLVTTACLAPVFLFAFDIKNALPLWRWLFYLRILADLTGHHYTLKSIQSGFADSPLFGFITLAAITFPIIPSYIAHFRYAFRQK